MKKHPEADVMVSFASLRSAYESTLEAMEYPQIKTIAIIAEGIPENMTRKIIKVADRKNVTIIGEAGEFKFKITVIIFLCGENEYLIRNSEFRICICRFRLQARPPLAASSPATSRSATRAA